MTVKLTRTGIRACALILTVLCFGAVGMTPAAAADNIPAVTITSAYMAQSSDYLLVGRIRGYTGLKSLTVSLNGNKSEAVPLAESFKIPLKLKPGQNEIVLKIVDKSGHSTTNMVVVTLEDSTQAGTFGINPAALAAWKKKYQNQMQAMHKELDKEPAPVVTQSAAESIKAFNDSASELRKTLASLGAATTPTPESSADGAVAKKKSSPEKQINDMVPLIEITSPRNTVSTNYLLSGSATDNTGISRLIASLNNNKPMPIKLNHGRFQTSLKLMQGVNVVRVTAFYGSEHKSVTKFRVMVRRPSSAQLIEAAVKKGVLDHNHALLYKVFAAFGNPRLPPQYKGDDSRTDDDHVLDEVADEFWSLPKKMQRAVFPYFIPPYYVGSKLGDASGSGDARVQPGVKTAVEHPVVESRVAITPAVYRVDGMVQARSASGYSLMEATAGRGNEVPVKGTGTGTPPCVIEFLAKNCVLSFKWHYLDGKHVRIWYADYKAENDKENVNNIQDWAPLTISPEAQAKKMLNAVEGPKGAWDKLTKLMHRVPMSDKGRHLNGGDGKLDIALNPDKIDGVPTHIGLTITYLRPTGCVPKPVFIVLQRDMPFDTIKSDMAHELMHAIQWTYNAKKGCVQNYSWLMESTAVWAQDYVFPDDNWEHFLAAHFIKNPQIPLEIADGNHEYWSYLFFFFLRWHFKDPDLIRQAWEATVNEPTGIRAAADALKKIHKKLDDVFPDFTVYNLGRTPMAEYYYWDGINTPADMKYIDTPLARTGDLAIPLMSANTSLKHLTAKHYLVNLYKQGARSVAVYNGYSYKLSDRIRPAAGLKGPIPTETLPVDMWALDALPKSLRRGRRVAVFLKLNGRWLKSVKNKKQPYAAIGPGLMFCREATHNQDYMMLIPSNSRLPGDGDSLGPEGEPPQVWESNIGCGPWAGEITAHDNGDGQSGAHWTFDTTFTTGNYVQQVSPMFTDKQLQDADSSGAPLPATAFGFAASSTGTGPERVGMWPLGSHFLQYFGAVMSFGTGYTTWTVNGGCGSQGSGQYKVLVVLITYNFVPRGDMRRQMTLVTAPESYLTNPLNADRAGLPYQQEDDSGHCHLAHRSEMNVQPIFGSFKPDNGTHASGEIIGADYLNGKKGCQAFDIELETGRKSPKPKAQGC